MTGSEPVSRDMNRIQIGEIGEAAAVKYLKRKGYKIVKRNHRTRYGEIDIVCEIKGSEPTLVFVEVKTKTGDRFGEPWEMVDKRKVGQIKRIATMYLKKEK